MKERPILFSAPMIQAILAGKKTQTRRIIKPNLAESLEDGYSSAAQIIENDHTPMGGLHATRFCPYGQPGDFLWVRETWCVGKPYDYIKPKDLFFGDEQSVLGVDYAANKNRIWSSRDQGRWRPSIHMPRWASRITIEVVSVRVERLQEISESDARAEGCEDCCAAPGHGPVVAYRGLWNFINGEGAWKINPWVWVIGFKNTVHLPDPPYWPGE